MYNPIDDFVMTNLSVYAGRTIKTAEAEGIDLGDGDDAKAKEGENGKDGEESEVVAGVGALSKEDAEDLCAWLKESALADRVSAVGLGW